MPLLALDTSSAASAAVVDDDGRTLASRSSDEPRRHAELLTPLIEQVLVEAGVDRAELTGIVVGTGPAPFTGLRVGLVTARTLGLALDIPVHGVSSLDALALAAVDRGLSDRTDLAERSVLVVTDARRREVYWATYRPVVGAGAQPSVEVLAGPAVGPAADLVPAELGDCLAVGPGTALYAAELAEVGVEVDSDPRAVAGVDSADLARVAQARLAAAVGVPESAVLLPTEPLYLRRPDAVPSAAAKRASA
ncbi:tRNA (adenosine(37)-N6)-threonylcarbamoyltransferase complex dimerization subunit type 1 TsaB [Cellulomonas sp. NPDC089187]|uniref:tRNA (adenosine(37)-N6)-threonylcarbamoyltransferase complex dimerization subunit type 1 TsaB n=1 Tax=Cellulomonas sp. NPDC089187 TaxID=3154970 RepID=UPI003436AF6D